MADTNGSSVSVEVLAERVTNISKRLDEQIALSKTAVDAALTAISVAKSDQVQTVNVAFAASQSAISKTEQSQKESNQKIGALENEVVRLAVTQATSSGKSGGMRDMYGWIFGGAMFIIAVAGLVFAALRK
jgi:wobble nucleotide-excising tRNase